MMTLDNDHEAELTDSVDRWRNDGCTICKVKKKGKKKKEKIWSNLLLFSVSRLSDVVSHEKVTEPL